MAVDDGSAAGEECDIFYVCKKSLGTLQEKLKKGEEVSQDAVLELAFPDKVADDAIMMPVDMRGVGEDFDDVEQMLEKLGPKGTAEAFIRAREHFEKQTAKDPEDERPKEMTAAEWREVLAADMGEGEEEEDLLEDEEEDLEDLEEEGNDEEGDGEPASKKAKTG
mmetsp:Transcript_74143/g.208130  ORF Transcript_74143/g.208130 Transcript_74143/m.208130 type:complete len:165 (+) Transcript_74143:96-590(+)